MKTSKIVTSGAALTLAIFLGLAGVSAAAQHDGHGPAGMGAGMGAHGISRLKYTQCFNARDQIDRAQWFLRQLRD